MSEGKRDASPSARSKNFLHDEDLAALLVRERKLSVEQTVDLLLPVVSALGSAHDAGAVHGDLRPRNIILSQRDHGQVAYVIGFGSPTEAEKAIERMGGGRVRVYQAPEQLVYGAGADARGDQFAFGAVLYQCVTGEAPFVSVSARELIAKVSECDYRRPRRLDPGVPRALEAIIVRTLARDPSARFASMRELGAALLPFASRGVQGAHVAEFGPLVMRRRTRAWASMGAGRSGTSTVSPAAARRRGVWAVTAGGLLVLTLLVVGARRSDEAPERVQPVADAPAPTAPTAPTAQVEQPAKDERRAEPVPAETDAPKDEPAAATSAPSAIQIDLSVEPRFAWIMLDLKAAGGGRLQRTLPVDGKEHVLRVGAPGYEVQAFRFKDAPPPKMVVLQKKDKRPPS